MVKGLPFVVQTETPPAAVREVEIEALAGHLRTALRDFHEQATASGNQAATNELVDSLAMLLAGEVFDAVADGLGRGFRSGYALGRAAQTDEPGRASS